MAKVFKDADIKMEILIKLAFGYSPIDISKTYNFTTNTIINLRKNNYKLFNKLVDEFRIIDEVAILGLLPVPERAVNICKKFYNKKFIIESPNVFRFNDKLLNIIDVIELANIILAKDDILPLNNQIVIKNLYIKNKEKKRERKISHKKERHI